MIDNSKARVLIVDDFAEWRYRVRQILQARPEWKIVGEACDGPEAVQKAAELLPDVVLLDLRLPTLNGMDAACIIRQRCPKSRIVFVTQDDDSEVRRAAIDLGDGFVLKTEAARELVNTIAIALRTHAAELSERQSLSASVSNSALGIVN